jgi:hypothetical protein
MRIDGLQHDIEEYRLRFRFSWKKAVIVGTLVLLAAGIAFSFGIVHASGPYTPAGMGGAEHPHYI